MIYDFKNPKLDFSYAKTFKDATYFREVNTGLWVRKVFIKPLGIALWVPQHISRIERHNENVNVNTTATPYKHLDSVGWQYRVYRTETPRVSKYFNELKLLHEIGYGDEDKLNYVESNCLRTLDMCICHYMEAISIGKISPESEAHSEMVRKKRRPRLLDKPNELATLQVTLKKASNEHFPSIKFEVRTLLNDEHLILHSRAMSLFKSSENDFQEALSISKEIAYYAYKCLSSGAKPTKEGFNALSKRQRELNLAYVNSLDDWIDFNQLVDLAMSKYMKSDANPKDMSLIVRSGNLKSDAITVNKSVTHNYYKRKFMCSNYSNSETFIKLGHLYAHMLSRIPDAYSKVNRFI